VVGQVNKVVVEEVKEVLVLELQVLILLQMVQELVETEKQIQLRDLL
jgi:hypothetical protein